jgi:hypothetical protein
MVSRAARSHRTLAFAAASRLFGRLATGKLRPDSVRKLSVRSVLGDRAYLVE